MIGKKKEKIKNDGVREIIEIKTLYWIYIYIYIFIPYKFLLLYNDFKIFLFEHLVCHYHFRVLSIYQHAYYFIFILFIYFFFFA